MLNSYINYSKLSNKEILELQEMSAKHFNSFGRQLPLVLPKVLEPTEGFASKPNSQPEIVQERLDKELDTTKYNK